MKKLFLTHIPKTAGSSLNDIFHAWFSSERMLVHLESKKPWLDRTLNLQAYDCLGGHVCYQESKARLDDSWLSATVLRKPDEHIVSHLAWVRKLAEPGEEARLKGHVDNIKRIVEMMHSLDLANPDDLARLVTWLEAHDLLIFHNTQTRYLAAGHHVNAHHARLAIKALQTIDFVGITERFEEYVLMLSHRLGKRPPEGQVKSNTNPQNFGIDMANPDMRKVLEPLISLDWVVYEYAREKFVRQLHEWLIEIELTSLYRFSSLNKQTVRDRLEQLQKNP